MMTKMQLTMILMIMLVLLGNMMLLNASPTIVQSNDNSMPNKLTNSTIHALINLLSPEYTCGGEYFDLSPLSAAGQIQSDKIKVGDGRDSILYMTVCGRVTQADCMMDVNAKDSMVCAYLSANTFEYYKVVDNDLTRGGNVWSQPAPNQVQLYSPTGESGNGCSIRSATILFKCAHDAITPRFKDVVSSDGCAYSFTIETSILCGNSCGGPYFDLSPLAADGQIQSDKIVGGNGQSAILYMTACGTVTESGCLSDPVSRKSMVCAYAPNGGYDYFKVVDNNLLLSQNVWSQPAPNHVQLYSPTGESGYGCATARSATILFRCAEKATTPRFAQATTEDRCAFSFTIETSILCDGGGGGDSTCGGPYFDLSPLAADGQIQSDKFVGGNGQTATLYMTACGTVTEKGCLSDANAKHSMVCVDISGSAFNYFRIIDNDLSNPQNVWSQPAHNQVQLYSPTGESGNGCFDVRSGVVLFRCAEKATVPRFADAITADGCAFSFTIETSILCGVISSNSSKGSDSEQ